MIVMILKSPYRKKNLQGELMRKSIPVMIFFIAGILLTSPPGQAADINIDTSSPFLAQNSSKKISMDFQEAPLIDVLKIFSQQSGFNLVTSEDLHDRTITVFLDNVPVDEALT